MSELHVISREKDGLDDVCSLELPLRWRMSARQATNRQMSRPWHDEDLRLPLETIAVDPARVLFWDNEPTRPNSTNRAAYMLANRAVPLVIRGGNTNRNILHLVTDRRVADVQGYGLSRIALTERVLAQLVTPPEKRLGHYRGANLHTLFRYEPPIGENLERMLDVLRSISKGE